MAVDKAFIQKITREFDDIDDSRITDLADLLAFRAQSSIWGDRADLALAYLVCHELKLDAQGGNGSVTSERLGDVSRTYARIGGDSNDELDSTSYGQRFKRLRRSTIVGARTTS